MNKNIAACALIVITSGLSGFAVSMFLAGFWISGVVCFAIISGIYGVCALMDRASED